MSLKQSHPLRFLHFENIFKIHKKKDIASPKLLSLLNDFETNFTQSIRKLIPKDKNNIITVSWMKLAIESLCKIHTSIKTLLTDLDLSMSELDEDLIYLYSEISLKLLDLCNVFTSELDRLNHGNLLLKFALSKLETNNKNCLNSWNDHMASKNPKIGNMAAVLSSLVESMNLPKKSKKKKEYVKVKVFLRALYGVKVKTLYIFSVFAAAFLDSSKNLLYLTVTKEMEEFPWAQSFMELQNMINPEIKNAFLSERFSVIKDVEAVEFGVKRLYAMELDGSVDITELVETLKESVMELSESFDIVAKEIHCLVKVVISARDALFEGLWKRYAQELRVKLPMMVKSVD